jgi:hypothetical protein
MARTNIELYEALRAPVGDEAARMIAEVVPAADDLAKKADLADLRAEMADLRAEMHREFSAMKGWMLALMIPLWLGVYGTIVTLIAQGR